MKKTLLNALNVCVISLIVSCSTSCKKFDWDPKPYVGDHDNQQLVDFNNVTVKCDQPAFSTFTCFDSNNMAELKTAIEEVNMSKKQRKKVNKLFKKLSL